MTELNSLYNKNVRFFNVSSKTIFYIKEKYIYT